MQFSQEGHICLTVDKQHLQSYPNELQCRFQLIVNGRAISQLRTMQGSRIGMVSIIYRAMRLDLVHRHCLQVLTAERAIGHLLILTNSIKAPSLSISHGIYLRRIIHPAELQACLCKCLVQSIW